MHSLGSTPEQGEAIGRRVGQQHSQPVGSLSQAIGDPQSKGDPLEEPHMGWNGNRKAAGFSLGGSSATNPTAQSSPKEGGFCRIHT